MTIVLPEYVYVIKNTFYRLESDYYWKIPIFASLRDVSSVGSERLLDRQEVTGSIPVRPTG